MNGECPSPYKGILGLVSPVFEDMLSFPQPSPSSASDIDELLPIITLAESSAKLDRLLRLCYPFPRLTFQSITDVEEVLVVAQKYQMRGAIVFLSRTLLSFAKGNIFATYAIACRFDLKNVARAAMLAYRNSKVGVLSSPLVDYVSQMDNISAGALFRLLRFCCEAKSEEEFEFTPPPKQTARAQPAPLGSHSFTSPSQTSDLVLQSMDDVRFHVTSVMLVIASPIMANIVGQDIVSSNSPRVVPVHMYSHMLCTILRFCYPFPDPELQDHMEEFREYVEVAREYQVPRLTAFVKRMCVKLAETDAVQAYFVAVQEGWEEEAREAAKHAVYQMLDVYVPEMENIPAKAYHRLLVFRHRCFDAVTSVVPRLNAKLHVLIRGLHWSQVASYDTKPRENTMFLDLIAMQMRFAMMTIMKLPSTPSDVILAPFPSVWCAISLVQGKSTATVTSASIAESLRLKNALEIALSNIEL